MSSPSASTLASAATGSALLVLGADGRVLIANAAARAVWQAAPGELAGDFFPELFAFEVTSQAPDWIQSQWEVLVAAAQAGPLRLKLQPKEAAEFEVEVRLEAAAGTPPHYLAYIVPPAAPAPAAPPPAAGDSLLAQLAERSPLGFFDLNFVRHEAHYSPAWKRLLGYAEHALPDTYETWLKLIHPDDSAAAPDRQGRAAAGTRPFSHEYRMRHADGRYVWIQCVGVQHYAPNGALQRVVGAHLDISDRKEFEEAALRADERLRLLGDRHRAGFLDLDFAAGTCWLSAGFRSLLGYAEAELPDSFESVLRSLPMEETAGGLPAYFLAPHPGQVSFFDTLRLRHREDRDVLVHACLVRQISRQKELQRVTGFVVALPEAAAMETEVGFSSAHLHALLAELQEGVLLADAEGKVLHYNPRAEKLLGRPLAQGLGQDAGEVFRLVHPLTGQPAESPVARALGQGEPTALTAEFALDTGTGAPQPVAFSARPVPLASGAPGGAVVVFRNPAEMSLTPEELVRANRFEALGQLAGGIAHDFNNLLTTILGGVSLAKDSRDLSGLENAERACASAQGLTKQLLSFARGGAGLRQVVKVATILQESVRLASAGSTVKLDVQVAPDTGAVLVDRAQLQQVFQNLVINAIQAMPAGRGEITLRAANHVLAAGELAPLPAGTYAAIEVRDNGSGIRPEHLQRIFDPFFTTKKTGTGLGLATVHSIVRRHGGQIGVESELGVGTAFTVFLPVAEQPEEVEARRAPAFNFATRTGRVLFMDDDPSICALTGTMLEGLGYKYDIAKDGDEAVRFYKRYLNIGRPYDVVIMDLTIVGGMGGEQCFRALRDLHPEVRAIIASGYDNDDMKRQFLDQGFCGYLTKPYRVGDLGRVIKKVLGG